MFKTADPSRRTPTWLQNGTKENIIWQLKMVFILGTFYAIKDWRERRQWEKKYNNL